MWSEGVVLAGKQPRINPWTLQLLPHELEQQFWSVTAPQQNYVSMDATTLGTTAIHVALACWAATFHSKHYMVIPLQLLCIAIFMTHCSLYVLRRQATHTVDAAGRLAVLSKLLVTTVLLALFGTFTSEDWARLFIDPRQQYRLPPWAISASMLCAYSLVHGVLTLHYPVPWRHGLWIHAASLVVGWRSLGGLHAALQHPFLIDVGAAFCRPAQLLAAFLFAWAALPQPRPPKHSTQCSEFGNAYLLAFSLCSMGCLLPIFVSYCREGRLKALHLARQQANHQQAQQHLPWLWQWRTYAAASLALLLASHSLSEMLLLWPPAAAAPAA
jgi:hypothetical protein